MPDASKVKSLAQFRATIWPPVAPTNNIYQSWNNYQEYARWWYQAVYAWQVNESLAQNTAGPAFDPRQEGLPDVFSPDAVFEVLDQLAPLDPFGHVWTDAEVDEYARLYGFSFRSAKTAISMGMFLG
jgi:hypothetical protein